MSRTFSVHCSFSIQNMFLISLSTTLIDSNSRSSLSMAGKRRVSTQRAECGWRSMAVLRPAEADAVLRQADLPLGLRARAPQSQVGPEIR